MNKNLSTSKINNKNFQHSKAKAKGFNFFNNKNKNLQPLKANKSLQLLEK
jgi:hypothetical protein